MSGQGGYRWNGLLNRNYPEDSHHQHDLLSSYVSDAPPRIHPTHADANTLVLLPNPLPQTPQPILAQVRTNLLHGALDFRCDRFVELTIWVGAGPWQD